MEYSRKPDTRIVGTKLDVKGNDMMLLRIKVSHETDMTKTTQ